MKKRLISGMRPTGKLHIGHLLGALVNWVKLQDEYESLFFVADWHALTTKYDETENFKNNSFEMLADWFACGLSYEKCVIFQQSLVKSHSELYLILGMVTPLGWLERCPTYKEQLQNLENKESANLGFLGYPVLQTADIALYKTSLVPVGEDQVPHLELAREIVRRFNFLYKTDLLVEPNALLTKTPRLLGIDGRKMSKSYDNSIYLSDSPLEIDEKVRKMITDPSRIKSTDIGHPEICNVFNMHEIFNEPEKSEIECSCKAGKIGCVECKKKLSANLQNLLAPIREKRQKIIADKSLLLDILREGSKKAQGIAEQNLAEIRSVMNLF